jgi:hypothetical protein
MPKDKKKTVREREKIYKENMRKEKKKVSDYIYSVMTKIKDDRPRCIIAAYHFG